MYTPYFLDCTAVVLPRHHTGQDEKIGPDTHTFNDWLGLIALGVRLFLGQNTDSDVVLRYVVERVESGEHPGGRMKKREMRGSS